MKIRGYKKIGEFSYRATHDKAEYKSGERNLKVMYTLHPYDFPYLGLDVEEKCSGKKVFEKHYSIEQGELPNLIESLVSDIESGKICG